MFLVLGAVVFVYASSQDSLDTNNSDQLTDMANNGVLNCTMRGPGRGMERVLGNELQPINGMLFENATISTVQGTIVSQVRGILILNADSGQIRVNVPREWTLGNEVVSSISLFNGTFLSSGQTVTINVLQTNLVSNASFSANVMMGYEAINASSTHAYAVLPFNLQANS